MADTMIDKRKLHGSNLNFYEKFNIYNMQRNIYVYKKLAISFARRFVFISVYEMYLLKEL
jgi:hypothetical protein